MPPPTRDNAAPCRGCLLPVCNPYVVGSEVAPGTSSAMTASAIGGRGGDAHEYEQRKRINVVKSVLFYSTICILCILAVWRSAAAVAAVGGDITTNNSYNQKW